METKPDKQQTVTRLALCVVVAVALYAAAGKVPPLEPYRPWLEEHKVQAIAITAAILFGLSLLLFPPEEGGAEPAAPEEGPCAGMKERRTCRKGGPPLTLRRRSGVQPWSSTGTAAAAPRQ